MIANPPTKNTTADGAEGQSLIQERVEDLIETPGGATAFQGPQHVVDT